MTEPASDYRGDYRRPTDREVILGRVFGVLPAPPLPDVSAPPRAVLDDLVLAALREPPCYVAFSGGRDSSAILAVATSLSRRHGLPEPIPLTERYPLAAESDESDWQQLVIDHLQLHDWLTIEFRHENDFVGPTAQEGLRRFGLLWPPALQMKPNVFRRIAGGSLLTGEGGDEALGTGRITALTRLVRGADRPGRSTLRAAARAVAPAWLRRRHGLSLDEAGRMLPWLGPDAVAEHVRLANADAASEPLRWSESVWWIGRQRVVADGHHNYALLAAECGVRPVHPFAETRFLAALARAGGALGYVGRTEMMTMLFADVLPPAVLERSTKAYFNQAYFGEATRRFAREWDGTGFDRAAVDPDVLRAEWLSDSPSAFSSALLQAAWLTQHAARHSE